MERISKQDVRDSIAYINKLLGRQNLKNGTQKGITGEYCSTYGGWLFTFHNGKTSYNPTHLRMSNREAYRFLDGIVEGLRLFGYI